MSGRRGARPMLLGLIAAMAPATVADGRGPPPPTGTLTLDMDDPVITVRIGDVPLRLRVDFDQRDVVELNADAAARLGLPFEAGSTDAVGRIAVASRVAAGAFAMNGLTVRVKLSTHGHCCDGVDGAIGPALLPYAMIRLARRDGPPAPAPAPAPALSFAARRNSDYGLQVAQPVGRETLWVKFSLSHGETIATASAGAILAKAQGGRFDGGTTPVEIAFGMKRPTRMIVLDRPIALAGFRFDRVRTRTADFGGKRELPQDMRQPGEIVVKRRVRRQPDWPAIVIGRDRLDRCAEIGLAPATLTLTLRCDFTGAGT